MTVMRGILTTKMLMLAICNNSKYSLNMAGEWFSENHESESPSQHLLAYGRELGYPDNTRLEFLSALEHLLRDELQLNDSQLVTYLETSKANFLEYENDLAADDEIEDKGRLQLEPYAMAPLILLWDDLRHLREPKDVAVWLQQAIDLALNEADLHEEDECVCDDVNSDDNSCALSPLCPVKMIAKTLAAEAIEEPKAGAMALEDPAVTIGMVRVQLTLAGQKGLLTDRQVKKLLRNYHKKRRPKSLSGDSGE
jgi:hypothetical protein